MTPLQSEIEQRGKRIFELVDKYPESLFSKAGFYQRLMTLSMRDEQLKLQLFRFVAVLPSLHTSDEIIEHLQEYFADGHESGKVAEFLGAGIRLAGIVPWISGPILRWNVSEMARQFIAGRNPNDVMRTLRKRRTQNIGFTVDLLGEAVVSETEADEYAARYLHLLEGLAHETKNWTDALEKNSELFPVVNLSVKFSALYSQIVRTTRRRQSPISRRSCGRFCVVRESWAHSSISTWKAMRTKIVLLNCSKPFLQRKSLRTGRMRESLSKPTCEILTRICVT